LPGCELASSDRSDGPLTRTEVIDGIREEPVKHGIRILDARLRDADDRDAQRGDADAIHVLLPWQRLAERELFGPALSGWR
jgi:hypothetical protein